MKRNRWFRLLSIGICIIIMCGVLAGCTSQPNVKTVKRRARDTEKDTNATGAELTTLYPLNMDPQNDCATKLVYEGLVTYDKGEIKPLLQSWEFNEDGTLSLLFI